MFWASFSWNAQSILLVIVIQSFSGFWCNSALDLERILLKTFSKFCLGIWSYSARKFEAKLLHIMSQCNLTFGPYSTKDSELFQLQVFSLSCSGLSFFLVLWSDSVEKYKAIFFWIVPSQASDQLLLRSGSQSRSCFLSTTAWDPHLILLLIKSARDIEPILLKILGLCWCRF